MRATSAVRVFTSPECILREHLILIGDLHSELSDHSCHFTSASVKPIRYRQIPCARRREECNSRISAPGASNLKPVIAIPDEKSFPSYDIRPHRGFFRPSRNDVVNDLIDIGILDQRRILSPGPDAVR